MTNIVTCKLSNHYEAGILILQFLLKCHTMCCSKEFIHSSDSERSTDDFEIDSNSMDHKKLARVRSMNAWLLVTTTVYKKHHADVCFMLVVNLLPCL